MPQSLGLAERLIGGGERDARLIREKMLEVFRSAGVTKVDYIALCEPETLAMVDERIDGPIVALVAAHVGETRLIDNRRIG